MWRRVKLPMCMTSDIVASAHDNCGHLSIRGTSSRHMLRRKSVYFFVGHLDAKGNIGRRHQQANG